MSSNTVDSDAPLPFAVPSPIGGDKDEGLTEAAESAVATDTEREEIEAILNANAARMRGTARDRMTVWAERGEQARKHGYTKPLPPFEILDHTDLFERAWGWDTILPYHPSYPLTRYKKYLLDYYLHNTAAGGLKLHGDHKHNGSDLASLADSCIKMESHLKYQWESRAKELSSDEIEVSLLSDKIVNCARQMTNVMGSEFPAAAIALKCITMEAELMVEWLISRNSVAADYIFVSNKIRQCALNFMASKHPEYAAPAAAMMGITKEAKLMCELLRKKCKSEHSADRMSCLIRDRTLTTMLSMCHEHSAAEESTGDNAAETLISGESEVKCCSEMEPVKSVIPEVGKENQNTKIEDMLAIPFGHLGGKADEHEAYGKGSKSAGKEKRVCLCEL